MKLKIAAIAGDGIGPEVLAEALLALRLLCDQEGVDLSVDEFPFGADHYLSTGELLPDAFVGRVCDDYHAVLFGAVGDPRIRDDAYGRGILLRLRQELDLYVNYRPYAFRALNGLFREQPLDCVVFRENTEDVYTASGGLLSRGGRNVLAIENAIFTREAVERIVRCAFRHAATEGRRSVMLCDKGNAMKFAGALWREVFREVAAEHPGIEARHMYIDAACMELVRDPGRFDVVVASNLFGDILSDLAAQMAGGIGFSPSANRNPEHPHFLGLYEPVHGSAPDIAGQGLANPAGALLSVALLLRDHGLKTAHDRLVQAVTATVASGLRTRDAGGQASTAAFGAAVRRQLSA